MVSTIYAWKLKCLIIAFILCASVLCSAVDGSSRSDIYRNKDAGKTLQGREMEDCPTATSVASDISFSLISLVKAIQICADRVLRYVVRLVQGTRPPTVTASSHYIPKETFLFFVS